MSKKQFSPKAQLALTFFREIILPQRYIIWKQWQKANLFQHWTQNCLWNSCYFICLGRYVSPEEAVLVANYAASKKFWIDR